MDDNVEAVVAAARAAVAQSVQGLVRSEAASFDDDEVP